jgi:hypothetical protein
MPSAKSPRKLPSIGLPIVAAVVVEMLKTVQRRIFYLTLIYGPIRNWRPSNVSSFEAMECLHAGD